MKKNEDEKLMDQILMFRKETKSLDHLRDEIDAIIIPYEEKYKEEIKK